MFTHLERVFDSFIHILFPERGKEKIVRSLSNEDILNLPKAQLLPQNSESGEVYSLFSYKDPRVQALIWELKYHRNSHAIHIVGKLLAEHIMEELSDKMMFEKVDEVLLVPIPITATRLRERKFCQTDLICREMMRYVNGSVVYAPNALTKIHDTEKQSWTKSREERLRNLAGSFAADSNNVRNKCIIVVDDVTTTGATIAEAKRALKSAGAKNVIAFTIAH